MQNKIRSAIGGLALLASSAFGDSTNAPVLLAPQKVEYPTRDKITLSATNFNNGALFNLYKSTNLADNSSWVKVPAMVYSGVNPTNVVTHSYTETNQAYRANAVFRLVTD